MLNYSRSILIHAPVDVVWAFHEQPDVLDKLTPPWQPVEVKRREGGLDVGAETEFQLHLGPIPIRWLARHTECVRYQQFTDVQVEGPFDRWTHRHQFVTENGKTYLTDAIAFSLPPGGLTDPLLGWLIQIQLDQLFEFRHRITRQECESSV